MKFLKQFAMAVLFAGVLVPAMAGSSPGATLLLVPREDGAVRIGLDVGTRHPTILLSYKLLPNGVLSLHGWSGREWVNVAPESYREGSFLPQRPVSAVMVGKPNMFLPEGLIPGEAWCPVVYRIDTVEVRPLLHLLGRHYGFKYKDWKWFSDNYGFPIRSINPDGLNLSWYHQRLGDRLRQEPDAGSDLRYLQVVRSAQAVVEEPAAEEPSAEIEGNPLASEAPQAEIVGGDNAEESALSELQDSVAETKSDE